MTVIPNWLLGARDQLEDGLAGPRKRLLDARVRTGLRAGWHEGVRHTPLLVGGIAFLWYAAGGWRGIPVFAAFWPIVLLPLTPVLFAILRAIAAGKASLDSLTTARIVSHELHDKERLAAAAELARGTPTTGSFAHAAIEDGIAQLERARHLVLASSTAKGPLLLPILLAIGLGLLPLVWQPERSVEPAEETLRVAGKSAPELAVRTARESAASRASSRSEDAPLSRAEESPRGAAQRAREATAERTRKPEEEPERGGASAASGAAGASAESGSAQSKGKKQKGGKESQSNAAAPGGAGSEAGAEAPESPQQPQTPKQPRSAKPKPKQPKATRNEQEPPKEGGGAQSGAARSGAQGSPVATGQRMREPAREGQQDASAEEDPAEDEPETSEQRGGAAPPSRDRQKSPSRELSISGDGPPQDGRGGPTPPKKARGTASLILGITIPDHVHGRPNPGTNKQSLADAPPRQEAHELALVAAAPNSTPAHAQSPALPRDWLAPLVLRYHELLRASAPGAKTTDTRK